MSDWKSAISEVATDAVERIKVIRAAKRLARGCQLCGGNSRSCVAHCYSKDYGTEHVRYLAIPMPTSCYELAVLSVAALQEDPLLGDYFGPPSHKCGGCGCLPGGFHHLGCEKQICPRCDYSHGCDCLEGWDCRTSPPLERFARALGFIAIAAEIVASPPDLQMPALLRAFRGKRGCREVETAMQEAADERERTKRAARTSETAPASPTKSAVQLRRGQYWEANGDSSKAIASYEQATRLDSSSVEAWLALGRSRGERQPIEHALHCFEQAHLLEPLNVEAIIGKASCLNQLRQPIAAITLTAPLLESAPNSPEAWFQHASGLAALERFPDAVAALEQVLNLEPGREEAWALRGEYQRKARSLRVELGGIGPLPVLATLRKQLGSAEHIAKGCNVPLEVARMLVRGANLAEEGAIDDAVELFDAVIERVPNFDRAWRYKARCLQFNNSFEKAGVCYQSCITSSNAQAADHEGLGTCQLRMGDAEAALCSFDRAIADDQEFIAAWLGRSLALEALGKHQSSLVRHPVLIWG